MRVCVCVLILQAILHSASHSAFCNHMMTVPDEVTLNKEPALIITLVVLSDWLHSVQKTKQKKPHHAIFQSIFSRQVSVRTQSCGQPAKAALSSELLNTK